MYFNMGVWVLEYISNITNEKTQLYFSSEKKAEEQEWFFYDHNILSDDEEQTIKIFKILIM